MLPVNRHTCFGPLMNRDLRRETHREELTVFQHEMNHHIGTEIFHVSDVGLEIGVRIGKPQMLWAHADFFCIEAGGHGSADEVHSR